MSYINVLRASHNVIELATPLSFYLYKPESDEGKLEVDPRKSHTEEHPRDIVGQPSGEVYHIGSGKEPGWGFKSCD